MRPSSAAASARCRAAASTSVAAASMAAPAAVWVSVMAAQPKRPRRNRPSRRPGQLLGGVELDVVVVVAGSVVVVVVLVGSVVVLVPDEELRVVDGVPLLPEPDTDRCVPGTWVEPFVSFTGCGCVGSACAVRR